MVLIDAKNVMVNAIGGSYGIGVLDEMKRVVIGVLILAIDVHVEREVELLDLQA
jgi:hypothetical protein